MHNHTVIKYPVSTEKVMRLMESENKLMFVVDMKANKADIKRAVEEMFDAKVTAVRTFVSTKGVKKAYISFALDTPAIDIATQLGLM